MRIGGVVFSGSKEPEILRSAARKDVLDESDICASIQTTDVEIDSIVA